MKLGHKAEGTAHYQQCREPKLVPVNPNSVATDADREFACACGLKVVVTPLSSIHHAEESAYGLAAQLLARRRR